MKIPRKKLNSSKSGGVIIKLLVGSAIVPQLLLAQDRFPRPDFQTGYTQPQTLFPAARLPVLAYLDIIILILALGSATFFALRYRSRIGIFFTMLASLAYFGFYRKGCICPVGAIQNVTAEIADPSFVLPVVVIFIFVIPLLFALFFGRVFCAAVCPLGALQEVVVYNPKRLPVWIEDVAKLIPHIYLSLAILFAATGTGFIICRFDPFVAVFHRGGSFGMIVWGGALLITGLFIARPYCRFLCPYGVLLGWLSYLSKWHVSITPEECVNCNLCVDSCPYNAILGPTPVADEPHKQSLQRVKVLIVAVPLCVIIGGIAGLFIHPSFAGTHPKVRLARQLLIEEKTQQKGSTVETETFRAGTVPVAAIIKSADMVRSKFKVGSVLVGCYLGLVIAIMLLKRSLLRSRIEYTPDRQHCISCGRCFRSCPKEHLRLQRVQEKKVKK